MLLSLMLTVTFILVDCKIYKRHVPNSVEPEQVEEAYNLIGWVNTLHLQQCVFVAIGENFFAIFLEKIPRPFDEDQETKDYFIGICDVDNLRKWKLCPVPVELKRPEDCNLDKDFQQSSRVYRRLCDLTELTNFGTQCNCDALIRGEKLYKVVGFPTCYRPKIESLLCGYNNVCGLSSCGITMVANRIFSVKCDKNCFGHKPFCESPEWQTAKPMEISSFWTDWGDSECSNPDCSSLSSDAKCINKNTGMGDVDCLGPGTSFSCPKSMDNCKCHVFIEDGMSKLIRISTVIPIPEYEEISFDDFIKNLPLQNEHRQINTKPNHVKHRLSRDLDDYDLPEKYFVQESLKPKVRTPEDDEYYNDVCAEVFSEKSKDQKEAKKKDEKESKKKGEKEAGKETKKQDTSKTAGNVNKPITTEDMSEKEEFRKISLFHDIHENEDVVDAPDRFPFSDRSSGTRIYFCTTSKVSCIVIFYSMIYVNIYKTIY